MKFLKSQSGLSLIELTVSLGISSIVMLTALTLLQKETERNSDYRESEDRALFFNCKLKMKRITRYTEDHLKNDAECTRLVEKYKYTANLASIYLMTKKSLTPQQIEDRTKKLCERLTLVYNKDKQDCRVPIYNCCNQDDKACIKKTIKDGLSTPCDYTTVKDALCNLEERGRIPDARFCSL